MLLGGFSPTAFSLGSSAIVKVLGQMAVNTEQVLRRKKRPSLLYTCFRKGALGGFCQLLFTFVSKSPFGAKVA